MYLGLKMPKQDQSFCLASFDGQVERSQYSKELKTQELICTDEFFCLALLCVSFGSMSMYSDLFSLFIYNISTTAGAPLAVHISKKKQ
jgi:hypothetical protein